MFDVLLFRPWWTYQPGSDWYAAPYHWFNLVEGMFWLGFALLVFARYVRHRNSWFEPAYALAFLAFGLSDFREAYVVQGWLLGLKGLILAAILVLRRIVLRRYYPQSRTY